MVDGERVKVLRIVRVLAMFTLPMSFGLYFSCNIRPILRIVVHIVLFDTYVKLSAG